MRAPTAIRAISPVGLTLLLVACGGAQYGEAEVSGGLGERTFGDKVSAYHGTSFIVIVDTQVDCLDMSWVTRNYFGSNEVESDLDFGAVQFSFAVDTEPAVGNYLYDGTQGQGPIDVWRLINDAPSGSTSAIDADTADEYVLSIEEVTEESITGTFDTLFPDGNASGSFTSVFCRNVR